MLLSLFPKLTYSKNIDDFHKFPGINFHTLHNQLTHLPLGILPSYAF